jgi:ribulose-phosphate 3-epimerase
MEDMQGAWHMKREVKIAASILAADFGKLLEDIKCVESAGADMLHIDVMDGHFVPNISIGVPVINSLKGRTSLPLDVHLMIENPEKYVKPFVEAGSDMLTFHVEIRAQVSKVIEDIKKSGIKTGLSLNPDTSVMRLEPYLDKIDTILVMTVNPGFGGQELKQEALDKISELRKKIDKKGLNTSIAVDGGINTSNAGKIIAAGADILVAGTAIFGAEDRAKAISGLRGGEDV